MPKDPLFSVDQSQFLGVKHLGVFEEHSHGQPSPQNWDSSQRRNGTEPEHPCQDMV